MKQPGISQSWLLEQNRATERLERALAGHPEVNKENARAMVAELHKTTVCCYTEAVAKVIDQITMGATFEDLGINQKA